MGENIIEFIIPNTLNQPLIWIEITIDDKYENKIIKRTFNFLFFPPMTNKIAKVIMKVKMNDKEKTMWGRNKNIINIIKVKIFILLNLFLKNSLLIKHIIKNRNALILDIGKFKRYKYKIMIIKPKNFAQKDFILIFLQIHNIIINNKLIWKPEIIKRWRIDICFTLSYNSLFKSFFLPIKIKEIYLTYKSGPVKR